MKISSRPLSNQNYISLALFTAFIFVCNPLRAEFDLTGYYAGGQYTNSGIEIVDPANSANRAKDDWGFLHAKFGKTLNDWLSAETHLAVSSATNDNEDHDYMVGLFLKAGRKLGEYRPYGLIGAAALNASEPGFQSETFSDVSYGAGIEIFGQKNIAISLEYIRLIDTERTDAGNDISIDTLSLGFVYYFSSESSPFNKNRNKIPSIRY
jgi:opacity protein-like surface antigen